MLAITGTALLGENSGNRAAPSILRVITQSIDKRGLIEAEERVLS
ncbi:MAG: hypothetical protein ACI8XU_000803 [Kiritimatiellia bacterium]|jgi:hypothetical protein